MFNATAIFVVVCYTMGVWHRAHIS